MALSYISSMAAQVLVTWVCSDSSMQDCEVYKKDIEPPAICAEVSEEILTRARKMQLRETVITYCTDSEGAEYDLPIPSDVIGFKGSKAKKSNLEY